MIRDNMHKIMVYTYGSTDENPERYAPERIEIQGYSIDFTVMHNIKSVQFTRKVFEPLPEKYKRMIAAKEASDSSPAPLQPASTEQSKEANGASEKSTELSSQAAPEKKDVGVQTSSPDTTTHESEPGAMQLDVSAMPASSSDGLKRKSPMLNESNNEGSKIKKRAVLESRDECGPFRDVDPQFNTEEIEEASGMEDIRNSLCTWKSKGEDSEEAKLLKYFGLVVPPSSLQFIVLQAVSVRGLQCVKNAIDKRFDNLERWDKYYTRMLHWLADYYYGVLITQPTVQQLIILKNFSAESSVRVRFSYKKLGLLE
uniref:Uncharacterized protein n=1 Tax=Trichogramma kaykai TaxID=54128 RepID=A0ABD2WBV0_9HYME